MKIFAAVRCPPGYKYDEKTKSCVPKNYSRIAKPGYVRIGFGGGKSSSQKNGNGTNGNGNGNGGNGNGNGGNGGGNGGGSP